MSTRLNENDKRGMAILEDMIDMAGRARGDADAGANGIAMVRAAMGKNPGKENPEMEPMSRKFRRLTRMLLIDDQIQALIRARVVDELTGAVKDTHVTCQLMRIAAGSMGMGNKSPKSEQNWVAPSLHVHLDKLSDEQLKAFYEQGVRPKVVDVTEQKKVLEIEE